MLHKRTISDVCFADRAGRIIIDHPDCHDYNQQIERHVLKKSIQGIAPPSTVIVMEKDLTGKELGKGFTQRKDGRYQTRISLGGGKKPICLYGHTLKEVKKKRENY